MFIPLLLTLSIQQDTTRWVVLNHGRPAGEMVAVNTRDSLLVRYQHVDRNRGPRVLMKYAMVSGRLAGAESRTFGADGTVSGPVDRWTSSGSFVRWGERDDSAQADGAFFRLRGSVVYDDYLLVRHLLSRPDRTTRLLPSGTARLEITDETVRAPGRRRVRLALLYTGSPTPAVLWLDQNNELLASGAQWFITVRPDAVDLLPHLRTIEADRRARHAEALRQRLMPAPVSTVAIVGGDVFDSERGTVLPRHTVLIQGDRITAVGPADAITVPQDARVIDASGKTVVPGLYDMHGHPQITGPTGVALSQLAAGVTTVRDLASDMDVAVWQRDRAAAGELVSPRFILGGFIEGPGGWAGPSEVIVRTEAEARAWVARYDSAGMKQIKLYNLLHPDLVPAIAAETHARGMRLSGHIPRGLSVPAAVLLGFDEIQHAAFLFSTFFQDSLYVPTMRAYSLVASLVSPTFDVDGAPMTGLIEFLRSHNTVIDGTFNLWMRSGAANPTDSATFQAGNRAYLRLIKRLYDAGVTMVPGTDNFAPWSLNTELETYERAGVPASFVLQMATITSARVMREDQDYGSIAVGKVADLAIIAGRPAERLADLRNIEQVVRAGRVFESSALFDAAGVQRRRRTNQAPATRGEDAEH